MVPHVAEAGESGVEPANLDKSSTKVVGNPATSKRRTRTTVRFATAPTPEIKKLELNGAPEVVQ